MRPNYPTTILPEDRREVERYATSGHTHHRLDYHFVWRTKYSKSILGPVLSPFLVDTISAICKENHVKLLGLAIAVNHVHCCLRLRPIHAPATVMKLIKGGSSHSVFEQFPQLEGRIGVRRLWARGYHVETLGDKNVFAILAYLARQDDKHDLKALEPYFHEIDEFLLRDAAREREDEIVDDEE